MPAKNWYEGLPWKMKRSKIDHRSDGAVSI